MRILIACENARTRARLERLSRTFRAHDVTIESGAEEAQGRLMSWLPDIVLMSGSIARRWGVDDPGASDATTFMTGADAGARPTLQDPDSRLVVEELAAIILALDADRTHRPPAIGATVSRAAPTVGLPGPLTPPPVTTELTAAERDVLAAVAAGLTASDIARSRGIPEPVVESCLGSVLAKLHRRGAQGSMPASKSRRTPSQRTT